MSLSGALKAKPPELTPSPLLLLFDSGKRLVKAVIQVASTPLPAGSIAMTCAGVMDFVSPAAS